MEEYIKKLLEQVRFEKAHKAIGDEIRSHIEDQIEANVLDGMDEETAEKSAVADMGDPVEAGAQLDKVHRPQMAWGVVIIALFVAIMGTGIIDDQGGGAFLPFVSNDKLVESYALLGILLSIYKYKNAYSQHVDIILRFDFNKLGLKKLK